MRAFALGLGIVVACGGEAHRDASPERAIAPDERDAGPVFARGRGVVVTLAEVEARIARTGESPSHAAEGLVDEAVLAARAHRAGLDRDAEAAAERRRVLVQKLLDEEVERRVTPETIPADVVARHYEENRRTWVHGEEVRVEHFLARLDERPTPEDEANGRAWAETILAAAQAAPAQPLEAHRSLVPSSAPVKIETLPPFSAGSVFDPAFEAPALALRRPNDLSAVVRTQFGFHVIRLLERLPAVNRPLAEVEGEIRTKILPEQRKRRLEALIGEIGRRRGVSVDTRPLALLP